MAVIFKSGIFSILFVFVLSKDLHMKRSSETKDKDPRGFMNLFNNEDVVMTNKRFVRHLKPTTENVLDHLMDEIRHEAMSGSYNPKSSIPRLIRILNRELLKKKQKKEKSKKKTKMEIKKNLRKKLLV